MANVKITELTAATALAGTDVLPIVDVGADATKKVSVSDLLRNLPDGSAASPSLAFADDQNSGILSPAENELAFATSGTQRLVIDSSGQIGIGTASPSNNLDIAVGANSEGINIGGSGNFFGLIQYDANRSGADQAIGDIAFKWNGTRVARIIGGTGTDTTNKDDGALQFHTASAGSATEKVRIDGSGRVGIGTSSPSRILQIKASSANTAHIALIDNDSSNEVWQVGNQSDGDGFMTLRTDGGTTSVLLDASGTNYINGGNVGIGTTSPGYELDVAGSIKASTQGRFGNGSASAPSYAFDSDHDTGMYRATTNVLGFATSGSERLRIDSSGRLLLGTTTEGQADADDLTVAGSGNTGITIRSGTTSHGAIYFSRGTSGNDEFNGFVDYDQDDNYLRFGSAGTERMRINSSGNIGIGTTSPSSPLHVKNAGSTACRFILENSGSGSDDSTQIWSQNNDLAFNTNDSERMRIDSSGRVLINRTSVFSSEKLSVVYAPANRGMVIDTDSTFTGNSNIIGFRANGSLGGSITFTNNGTTTAYVTSSDYRLKENVVDLDGAIDRVKQLAPKRFNFIADANKTVDGFLAHEAQTVVPEAVFGTHNEVEVWRESEELPEGVSAGDTKLDEDGNPIPKYQGIDQSKLVPLLTAALQEAIGKIEALETRVAQLEGGAA